MRRESHDLETSEKLEKLVRGILARIWREMSFGKLGISRLDDGGEIEEEGSEKELSMFNCCCVVR